MSVTGSAKSVMMRVYTAGKAYIWSEKEDILNIVSRSENTDNNKRGRPCGQPLSYFMLLLFNLFRPIRRRLHRLRHRRRHRRRCLQPRRLRRRRRLHFLQPLRRC